MREEKQFIQLSVFDRLEKLPDTGYLGSRVSDIEIVRTSVLRDVENLLNTRRIIIPPSSEYKYVNQSVYVYGLEDFISKNPKVPKVRNTLRNCILDTIHRFEPRLSNATIEFNEEEGNDQNLCFTVVATLFADPIHEPIFFDTWFLVSRGEYRVTKTN